MDWVNMERFMDWYPNAFLRFVNTEYGKNKVFQIAVPVHLALFAFAFPSLAFMLPSPRFFLTTFVAFNFFSNSFMAFANLIFILKTRSVFTYELVNLLPNLYIFYRLVNSIPFDEEKYTNITTLLQGFIIPMLVFFTHLSSLRVLYLKLRNGFDFMVGDNDWVHVHHGQVVRRRF